MLIPIIESTWNVITLHRKPIALSKSLLLSHMSISPKSVLETTKMPPMFNAPYSLTTRTFERWWRKADLGFMNGWFCALGVAARSKLGVGRRLQLRPCALRDTELALVQSLPRVSHCELLEPNVSFVFI